MKIVFMGTPDFSVAPLSALLANGHEIVLCVTQPDKPKGRGHKLTPPPVKTCAEEHGIPVYQPVSMKSEESYEVLKAQNADVFVVVAFGQILPQRILDLPKYGCINIHASLLPQYRGAAPIQWVIVNGEEVSGVTTMQMDAGVDTGDMLKKITVPIAPDETGATLHDKLQEVGAKLIVETLNDIACGKCTKTPQDHSAASYAPMLNKETGRMDFSQSAESLSCLVRGLNPYPCAYTHYGEKRMRVFAAQVLPEESGKIGEVLSVTADGIRVKCGQGVLNITEVQFDGKKRMPVGEYLKGNILTPGVILG